MTGADLLQQLPRPQQQQQASDAIDASVASVDASDADDAPLTAAASTASEYVLDRAPTQTPGDRLHAKCGGRYVSVVRLDGGGLACVDSICYHAGGNLGLGDLEDDVLVCPQHRFRVCLRTGDAVEGGEAHARARQRLHVAYEKEGSLRVRLGTNGDAASDRFASADENMWNDTMWREIRIARPVE
jgi:nitrite reductase/ring-hydroxylating ferredoxin subunit